MQQYIPFLLFLLGLIMIIKGSDWFIDATIWIAKILKIPNIIIGATLVSLCTTLPEAMVSSSSALRGNTEIAFGNAIGSIACNTGFILALTLILSQPKITDKKKLHKKGLFLLILLGLVTTVATVLEQIPRQWGFILLTILLLYLIYNVRTATMSATEIKRDKAIDKSKPTVIKNIIWFVIGITLTITGANLLVINGEIMARLLGVPDIIIGVTLTAFGTSLPELVTAITAILKKAHDISIGNVLGANILNIILVLGLSSSILPIHIDQNYIHYHLPFIFLIVGLVVLFSFLNKKRFRRWNGILILAAYSLYLFFMFV